MRLIKKTGYKTVTDFYYDLSQEKIDVNAVIDSYLDLDRKENEESTESRTAENYVQPHFSEEFGKEDVLVIDQNLKGIDYKLSKCCNPSGIGSLRRAGRESKALSMLPFCVSSEMMISVL